MDKFIYYLDSAFIITFKLTDISILSIIIFQRLLPLISIQERIHLHAHSKLYLGVVAVSFIIAAIIIAIIVTIIAVIAITIITNVITIRTTLAIATTVYSVKTFCV